MEEREVVEAVNKLKRKLLNTTEVRLFVDNTSDHV